LPPDPNTTSTPQPLIGEQPGIDDGQGGIDNSQDPRDSADQESSWLDFFKGDNRDTSIDSPQKSFNIVPKAKKIVSSIIAIPNRTIAFVSEAIGGRPKSLSVVAPQIDHQETVNIDIETPPPTLSVEETVISKSERPVIIKLQPIVQQAQDRRDTVRSLTRSKDQREWTFLALFIILLISVASLIRLRLSLHEGGDSPQPIN